VHTMQIGGLTLHESLPVFTGDAQELVPHHDGRLGEVAGNLGPGIVERYVVRLDYARKRMTLTPFSQFRPAPHAVSLKFRLDSYRLPVVGARVDGIPGEFEVDVRARAGMLFAPFVRRGDFTRRYAGARPVRSSAARNEYRVSQLAIGPFVLHESLMWFSADTKGKFATGEVAGLLGNNALSKFILTLNYRTSRVYLQPSELHARTAGISRELHITGANVFAARCIEKIDRAFPVRKRAARVHQFLIRRGGHDVNRAPYTGNGDEPLGRIDRTGVRAGPMRRLV
jgi:hypothetical protein